MMGLLSVIIPAAGVPLAYMAPLRSRAPLLLVGVALLDVAVALTIAAGVSSTASPTFVEGFFVADATTRLFLLLVNGIFLGIATNVWTRVRAEPELRKGVEKYVGYSLVFIAASNLALQAHHLIALWIFLELTTLAAVPLIQHGGLPAAVHASWKYFLFSGVGLALAFLGFSCLGRSMELAGTHEVTFFLDELARTAPHAPDVWWRLGLALIFLGFGTKLGLAPMYAWLPDTYAAAPPATTALLAAVQFNVALVGLLRVLQVVRAAAPLEVSHQLIALGVATMLISSLSIIAVRNYTKLIAYASLNHAGVIAVGLGIGGEAAYGAVVYLVSNAFIKAILFLSAGKIRSYYQTDDMREVSGLIKDLPYTGVFFMIGMFALLGLPPFGSFLGELIIMSGLIARGYVSVFVAFCGVLTIAFVAVGRSVFPMIWGEVRRKANWAGQPVATLVPKLLFLCALVAMGLYLPAPVNELFRQVAKTLGGP
jgi:hydrogenase-4 component F